MSDTSTDYDFPGSGSLFPPPNMFTTPPPTPSSFTPPTHNSPLSGSLTLVMVLGIMLGIIVLAICWGRRRDKLQNESTGEKNMKNDNTLVDLESGLSKSQYKGSVHPLKKSVKNFDAYQGDMVHGYDKKLSSSKINAEYYNEFINKIDAKNCYSHERNRKFEFDERLSSSRHKLLHTEKSKELPLDKETNETNSRVPYPEYESEERSSSSEDEVFHTRQSKKANFPKGARRTPKI